MEAIATWYKIPIPTLVLRVRKSMNELRGGLTRDQALREAVKLMVQ